MNKRGPHKVVKSAERVGDHGSSRWIMMLECGHSVEKTRRLTPELDKASCKKCLGSNLPNPYTTKEVPIAYDYDDPMGTIRLQAKIASRFGVEMDKVEVGYGIAKVYLDADDIRKIISG